MAASTRSVPFPAAAACCSASRARASAQPMLTSLATSASSCTVPGALPQSAKQAQLSPRPLSRPIERGQLRTRPPL